MSPLKNVSVGAKLLLVHVQQLWRIDGAGRRFEVEQFQASVAAHQQVDLAGQNVSVLFDAHIDFGLDDPPQFLFVVPEGDQLRRFAPDDVFSLSIVRLFRRLCGQNVEL